MGCGFSSQVAALNNEEVSVKEPQLEPVKMLLTAKSLIEIETKLYEGNFEYIPEMPSSTIRIFLSSTFSGF